MGQFVFESRETRMVAVRNILPPLYNSPQGGSLLSGKAGRAGTVIIMVVTTREGTAVLG